MDAYAKRTEVIAAKYTTRVGQTGWANRLVK